MPGKKISYWMQTLIKILSKEGYSTGEIAARLQLEQKTVSRSINNFKITENYGYSKTKSHHKSTSKHMNGGVGVKADCLKKDLGL